jgi:60 kDa SS-A/Ro ribonucleoprotein
LATLVYKGGAGFRGSKTWLPVRSVLDALEDAYDASFDHCVATYKRILIGVDVSGSMSVTCVGSPIASSTAASAMALTLARIEPHSIVVQFDTAVRKIVPITKRSGIASIESVVGGGTDVAAPVRWASGVEGRQRGWGYGGLASPGLSAKKQVFDAFVILTDNETWAGNGHTSEVLETYRAQVNSKARLVCCAMAANQANVVDPNDPLSFGCAGLDASVPDLVTEFLSR